MNGIKAKKLRVALGLTVAQVAVEAKCAIVTLIKYEKGEKVRLDIQQGIERTLAQFARMREQQDKEIHSQLKSVLP